MRTVKYTKRFQRDYKREQSGIHSKKLDALLMEVVNLLAVDAPLPLRNRDHALSGKGPIAGIVTFGPIWCRFTASRMRTASNSCGSGRTANLAFEGGGCHGFDRICPRLDG